MGRKKQVEEPQYTEEDLEEAIEEEEDEAAEQTEGAIEDVVPEEEETEASHKEGCTYATYPFVCNCKV